MEKSVRNLSVFVVLASCFYVASAQTCPTLDERVAKLEKLCSPPHPLPEGWTEASNGFYYKYFNARVDYQTAKSNCEALGARLVSTGMQTAAMRSEVKALLPANYVDCWVGLDDLVTQGTYVWSDGTASTQENTEWGGATAHEPNNASERCVSMHTMNKGGLADRFCSLGIPYICEMEP